MKSRMSCLVTRPAWPVPGTDAISTPCSSAIFRTTGLIGKEGDEIAEAPQYEGIGVIIATDPSASRLIVDHEEIRGFMAAMVMGYVVDSPVLLDGLMEGDRVRFTIDAEKNAIVRIERIASD